MVVAGTAAVGMVAAASTAAASMEAAVIASALTAVAVCIAAAVMVTAAAVTAGGMVAITPVLVDPCSWSGGCAAPSGLLKSPPRGFETVNRTDSKGSPERNRTAAEMSFSTAC
jgi:hypothetical protein